MQQQNNNNNKSFKNFETIENGGLFVKNIK